MTRGGRGGAEQIWASDGPWSWQQPLGLSPAQPIPGRFPQGQQEASPRRATTRVPLQVVPPPASQAALPGTPPQPADPRPSQDAAQPRPAPGSSRPPRAAPATFPWRANAPLLHRLTAGSARASPAGLRGGLERDSGMPRRRVGPALPASGARPHTHRGGASSSPALPSVRIFLGSGLTVAWECGNKHSPTPMPPAASPGAARSPGECIRLLSESG